MATIQELEKISRERYTKAGLSPATCANGFCRRHATHEVMGNDTRTGMHCGLFCARCAPAMLRRRQMLESMRDVRAMHDGRV